MSDVEFQRQYRAAPIQSQCVTAPTQTTMFERAPIVEETVHKKIIEEVQPVLYKEVIRPVVLQETQPIYETVHETPFLVTEERPMRDLGTHFLGAVPQPCVPRETIVQPPPMVVQPVQQPPQQVQEKKEPPKVQQEEKVVTSEVFTGHHCLAEMYGANVGHHHHKHHH